MVWYSRTAKSGYGPATASLAMMYSEGRGVPQDQKTSDFLMESAKGAAPASALVSVEP
jgi:TPR repeat protein